MQQMRFLAVVAVAALTAASALAASGPRASHTAAGSKAAQASLLRVSDLGSGWTSEKVTGAQSGLNFSCQGFTPKQGDLVEIGTATSPNFRGSQIGPFLLQRTSVYEDAKTVSTLWRRAVKPRLLECVAQSLEGLRDRGVQVTINSKETLALGALAERTAAYRVVATLTTKGQRLKAYYDVILLAGRQSITRIEISQFQKAPPLDVERALSKIAARRLGASGPAA
jgi:hypothetical protein